MNFGGGIRIYYGFFEDKVVLLLSGGNKNTQKRDIQKAILYMSEFLEVKNEKKI
jgi:putative addiction module killer protein